ncbi:MULTISPECIES: alanine racemase [unclassified Gordonia (in: high G+C Gram-positive bacteria)]|uniref:alanine racemase n=1 Tax=unclassified Gordonia (in: high G+C Gram-positive bacteria) TaxID=2657482 RepID=UPI001FFFA3D1|nr:MULTISPECIES: alanine racemase [unclassified Gordonia (in: high G+C Gram-positive bacteria)]UQE76108.1 alanine racemase [Gordonia sp. PP30]
MRPALEASVDLSAIAHNVGVITERAGVPLIAVVKADGYGHGATPVARAALAAGAAELGVAHLTEALALRADGIDAHLTSWLHTPDTDFAAGIAAGVDLAVSSPRQLAAVVAAARELGTTATVTVKVDTGLGRSGIAPGEWEQTAREVAAAQAEGAVRLRAAMCHLAFGDEPDHPMNTRQADRLDAAVADLRRLGAAPDVVHIANSPAALTRPDLARDLVRPGIAVYGYSPIPELGDFGLIPAMTLSAQVALVKNIPAGQGVSYGHRWVAPRDTTIAVLPAGYADGVPRLLSGRFEVSINGRRFPGVGRVCMDQLVVDLGPDGGGVTEGDRAVLFGATGPGEPSLPTATDWADAIGTIDYEIVTGIRGRAVRSYRGAAGEAQ